MPFFDPLPPLELPDPRPYTPEEWEGPAPNVLGTPVAGRAVLVHRPDLLIAVVGITAFPNGIRFTVIMKSPVRDLDEAIHDAFHGARRGRGAEDRNATFRFGVQLADGRTATDTGPAGRDPGWAAIGGGGPPASPMLLESGGGGGGGGHWSRGFWLWPLPPEGALTFVCQWLALDVPESRAAVDAAPIRAAAEDCVTLWDMPRASGGGGGSSRLVFRARRKDSPEQDG